MKKIILSVFVIVFFVLYSFGMRHDNSPTAVTMSTSSGQDNPSSSVTGSAPSNVTQTTGAYKDGKYVGKAADAFYGNIQVEAVIQGGKITAVRFLQYPNDRRNSVEINQQAMPYLQEEAIKAQSAHVNGVSGATDTSQAFVQSLSSALLQAV